MKSTVLFFLIFIITSCGGTEKVNITGAEPYIETITGFTCEKAAITNNGMLVIAIDAEISSNYNALASQFLNEAKREGVKGLKGVLIVDYKTAKFEPGAVIGKRLGKAYDK